MTPKQAYHYIRKYGLAIYPLRHHGGEVVGWQCSGDSDTTLTMASSTTQVMLFRGINRALAPNPEDAVEEWLAARNLRPEDN